ncbi:hypothetical protein HPB51_002048 [Rhipicephalus microplus]|uniref:Ig-like domain-containing protein n=1 Tax=Rhipicephalus microplus TaxID=6941 RepID=A0A9J6DSC5_RHIMP|nr:hypothetical protein HPB51_002048 [Rhipicephalus microplus]
MKYRQECVVPRGDGETQSLRVDFGKEKEIPSTAAARTWLGDRCWLRGNSQAKKAKEKPRSGASQSQLVATGVAPVAQTRERSIQLTWGGQGRKTRLDEKCWTNSGKGRARLGRLRDKLYHLSSGEGNEQTHSSFTPETIHGCRAAMTISILTHNHYGQDHPAVCLLVNLVDIVKGSSGPRWLSEPPARLLFSNWTGATVRCSAEGDPRPNVWWVSAVDGLNASALSAATSRPQLLTVHEGTLTFMPFRANQFREEVHRGSFRCRARNARGTVLSTAVHVNAVVAQDWELRMWSAPGSVPRGSALLVRCPVPSHVSHHVIVTAWEEEHLSPALITPRSPTDRYVMLSSGDLYVRSMTQAARFRCHTDDVLTRRNRTSANYAHYHVTEPPGSEIPSITFHSGHVTVEQGRPTDLVCLAQGWPPPKYK